MELSPIHTQPPFLLTKWSTAVSFFTFFLLIVCSLIFKVPKIVEAKAALINSESGYGSLEKSFDQLLDIEIAGINVQHFKLGHEVKVIFDTDAFPKKRMLEGRIVDICEFTKSDTYTVRIRLCNARVIMNLNRSRDEIKAQIVTSNYSLFDHIAYTLISKV